MPTSVGETPLAMSMANSFSGLLRAQRSAQRPLIKATKSSGTHMTKHPNIIGKSSFKYNPR